MMLKTQFNVACESPNCFETATSADGMLTYIGEESPGGSYVLVVQIDEDVEMPFGRFKGGKRIPVKAGSYTYVGSALNPESGKPRPTLARRLLRHASRCKAAASHPIRRFMSEDFERVGLTLGNDLRSERLKKHKWNIDSLIDLPIATLVSAFVIRCPYRIEKALGRLLLDDPATVAFEPGLGANDLEGSTHLLRVEANEDWWTNLSGKLRQFCTYAKPEASV